jgi:hypothetical protein
MGKTTRENKNFTGASHFGDQEPNPFLSKITIVSTGVGPHIHSAMVGWKVQS